MAQRKLEIHMKKNYWLAKNPPGINLDKIGIMDLKEMFKGGWPEFVQRYPQAAYRFAMENDTPILARAFLIRYESPNYGLAMKRCCENLKTRYKHGSITRPKTTSELVERLNARRGVGF